MIENYDPDKYFFDHGESAGDSVIVSGWPECEIEACAEKVHAAAVGVVVAEFGRMPVEVVTWKRNQLEDAVEQAAQTW